MVDDFVEAVDALVVISRQSRPLRGVDGLDSRTTKAEIYSV